MAASSRPAHSRTRTPARRSATCEATPVVVDHVVALGDAWQMGAARWAGRARLVRQRPAQPARGQRVGEPAKGRCRRRVVAAADAVVPLHLHRATGRRQAEVPPRGDRGRAGSDAAGARLVSDAAAARERRHLGLPGHASAEGPGAAFRGAELRELLCGARCRRDADQARDEAVRGEPGLDRDGDGIACE